MFRVSVNGDRNVSHRGKHSPGKFNYVYPKLDVLSAHSSERAH